MINGNKNTLPNVLKAKSVKALRRKMMANNIRLAMDYVNYSFTIDGDTWYAWYNEPLHKTKELREANGIIEND